MPPQPSGSQGSGRPRSPLRGQFLICSLQDLQTRLDTDQIEGELDAIFRESPEFGRNLALRLESFLGETSAGHLTLIGAGGEASVFGDPDRQEVIKLSGPPARCNFGWIIRRDTSGLLTLVPGCLDAILDRLALFEALFPSGIQIDCIGENDAFLVFRQPFIVGRHPSETELENHMRAIGWVPEITPCCGETLEKLTWAKGCFLATYVRPENAIISEASGIIHPIDFIVVGSSDLLKS